MSARRTLTDADRNPGTFDAWAWRLIVSALIALQCVPIWIWRYFPSQDGPSHLSNAAVMMNYRSQPVYAQYYELHWLRPAGNFLSQYLLIALAPLTGLLFAQKIWLSLYLLAVPLSLYYLLRPLTPHARVFSLFGLLLGPNYFLHMGFWNFCFSIPLTFVALGFYVRHCTRWTARSAAGVVAVGFIVYSSHVFSYLGFVVLAGLWAVLRISWTTYRSRLQLATSLAVLTPPALLWLMYTLQQRERTVLMLSTLRERLWYFYSASFLGLFGSFDLTVSRLFVPGMALLIAISLFRMVRRNQSNRASAPFLAASAVFAILTLVSPDAIGSASDLLSRVSFYVWISLIIWVSMQQWPRMLLRTIAAAVCLLALLGLIGRMPAYIRWNSTLTQFARLAVFVPPGSTLLPAVLVAEPSGPDPAFHASGLLTLRGVINLANYEASTDVFTVSYRPERSPDPDLGTLRQIGHVPPFFDIDRYERNTRGRVDFLLFQGGAASGGKWPEEKLYQPQLTSFVFLAMTQPGNIARLYRRK